MIKNAVYNINAGRAFDMMTLSSELPIEFFDNCNYHPDQQDEESKQTIKSASVSVERPDLFDQENGGFPRLILNGSCADLVFTTSKFRFGKTRMALTVQDSEGMMRTKIVVFDVFPVDTGPTAKLQAKIELQEDALCRKTFDLYSAAADKLDGNWSAKSGCPHEYRGIATEIRAGGFPDEMCTNCPDSPPCENSGNCKQQLLTFVLDDVS
jgi:hypothetical protein